MNSKPRLMLALAIGGVSYLTQFLLLRPGEGPEVAIALGTVSWAATVGVVMFIEWVAGL